ncbi:DUF6578 domain-containing protein [Streptomyces sp. NPDC004562]|uniref:DUF6578 domain-containing protein n=1 Tax=Streptomyces sp. NPDC004562 TaxID=3364703 RepID=UPI0036A15D1A
MTTVTIWVDGWQMQCCGESFAPGDAVSWPLLREAGRTGTGHALRNLRPGDSAATAQGPPPSKRTEF